VAESKYGNSKCPKCGSLVDGVRNVRYDSSFACPNCMTQLKVPAYYKLLMAGISVWISYFLIKSLGLHGDGFLVGFIVLILPSLFTVSILLRKISPPKLVVDNSSPFG
jgi:hypothetical protein